MAFPNNPNPGDTYTDEYGTVWVYAGPINGWYRQTVIPVNDTTYIGSDGAPGGIGNNTEVVFNDNGSLASDSGLTYNKTTDALSGGAFVPTGSTVPSNGVYRPSANNVAISTNGTGRLFIDSNGRVGVGTASPSQPIHLRIDQEGYTWSRIDNQSTSSSAYAGLMLAASGNTWGLVNGSSAANSNSLAFVLDAGGTNSEKMRLDSSGRLGLGTSSPGHLLHVAGSSVTTLIEATGGTGADFLIGDGTIRYYGLRGVAGGGSLQIRNHTANTTLATFTNTGRVGIGTTSVSDKLHVSGIARVARSTDAAQYGTISIETGNVVINAEGGINTTFANGGSEKVRIDSSGRLLVGTSSSAGNGSTIQALGPNAVEVFRYSAPTGNSGPNISLTRSASNTVGALAAVAATDELGQITFKGAGDGTTFVEGAAIKAIVESGTISGSSLPTRLVFATTADGASSPTERMRITNAGFSYFFSNGATVIASTADSAGTSTAIYVGRNSATASNIGSGNDCIYIYSNGNVVNTNNSYGAISDIKLKENIVDASSQWDDLKALQVRNYNFKEGQTHTQIGLVAQEVELVSPGLVSESPDRDEDGNDLGTVTKSVNYSVLYMKAVKALQEAMERIETLEQRLNDAGIA